MDMLTINVEDGFELIVNLVQNEEWEGCNILPDLFSGDRLYLESINCDMDTGHIICLMKRINDGKGVMDYFHWPELTMQEIGVFLKNGWIKRI